MRSHLYLLILTLLSVQLTTGYASVLEDQLERELKGSWCVVLVEVYSDCTGFYNNNEFVGGRVASKADQRFPPGELAKIDKINLKRSRLDLFMSLAEPILTGHTDGPFMLYEERRCKVQLIIELPRDMGKNGSPELILEHVTTALETAPTLGAAQALESWNQRTREPYPDDYELTLAQYEVWKAEQINAAVSVRAARAHQDAIGVTTHLRHDRAYLAGFAMGVEKMRSWDEHDCVALVEARFDRIADRPRDSNGKKGWNEGYRDGQELVFNLYLADLLQGCYVDPGLGMIMGYDSCKPGRKGWQFELDAPHAEPGYPPGPAGSGDG